MFETSLLFNNPSSQDSVNGWSWPKVKLAASLVILILGISSVSWGTWLFFKPASLVVTSTDIPLLNLQPPSSIYVDVGGAVEKPGIYPLAEGERLAAALELAGGLSIDADTDYINSTLNLSARLKDEQKVYVPFKGEQELETLTIPVTTSPTSNTLVSINSATVDELDELPKVGPATAQKIIDGRPYTAIDQLLTNKVVGEAVYAEIKELIKI